LVFGSGFIPLGKLLNRNASGDANESHNSGVPIVLTASTIEMSDFNLNPFIAFTGGFLVKNRGSGAYRRRLSIKPFARRPRMLFK
jgi:hypothetical protein